jgi:hypothetical protein
LQELRGALGALHRAGAAHGAVDPAHVHLHEGAAQLVFPREPVAGATSESDCRQLEELGRARG